MILKAILALSLSFASYSVFADNPDIDWVSAARGTWKGTMEYGTPNGKKRAELTVMVEPVGGKPIPGGDWELVYQYTGKPAVKFVMKRDRRGGVDHWLIDQQNKVELDAFELPGPTLSMTNYTEKEPKELNTTRYTVMGNIMILTSESIAPGQPMSKTGGAGGSPVVYNYGYISTLYGLLTKK